MVIDYVRLMIVCIDFGRNKRHEMVPGVHTTDLLMMTWIQMNLLLQGVIVPGIMFQQVCIFKRFISG
jgi:hypothetical protein